MKTYDYSAPCENEKCFRETMIKVLTNLKDNKDMLMAVMDVFVQEPTLDWNRMASR